MYAWAASTSWSAALAGDDVPEGDRWRPMADEHGITFGWALPGTRPGDGDAAHAIITTTGDGVEVLELTDHAPDTPAWWPAVHNRPVDALTAWAGVRGHTRAEAARRLGLTDTDDGDEWFWDRPGLAAIRDAADMKKANRWATLGSTMAWVAAHIDPAAQLETRAHLPGTVNLFVVAVAQSGGGKSKSLRLGTSIVVPDAGPAMFAPPAQAPIGSPEGMAARLELPSTDEDDDGAAPAVPPVRPRVLFTADELTRLYGERRGSNSTQEGYLLSMWAAEDLGASLVDKGKSRHIPPHSYRACLFVGGQPKYVSRLAAETDSGLAQRFLFLPALPTPGSHRRPGLPESMPSLTINRRVLDHRGPIAVDAVVQDDMERLADERMEAEAAGAEVDPFHAHREYNRERVAAVLSAIIHGRLEVTAETWELAGVVMDISDSTRRHAIADARRAEHAAAVAKRVEQRDADDGADDVDMERVKDKLLAALKAGNGTCTRKQWTQRLRTSRLRAMQTEAAYQLVSEGRVRLTKYDGDGKALPFDAHESRVKRWEFHLVQ